MIYLDILTACVYISVSNAFLAIARWASGIASALAKSAGQRLARWDE